MPPKLPPTKRPVAPKANAPREVSTKRFSIEPWSGEGEGEKILLYSRSGMGKTTLASMAPNPVFIGVDPGGKKIRRDGKPLRHIPVTHWQELRAAILQDDLWSAGDTLVIDTLTRVESEWCVPFVIETVPTEKGQRVTSIEKYGYGKGWQFVLDHERLLQADLDRLATRGVNILLLCQETAIPVPNAEGLDYLQAGPKLMHTGSKHIVSARLEWCEWADHVLRIDYADTHVAGDTTVGKLVTADTTRVVQTADGRYYTAKSRPIVGREPLPPVITFDSRDDDSLWAYCFGEGETA